MDGEGGVAGLSRGGRAVSPHVAGLTDIVGRENELRDLRAAFGRNRVQVLVGTGGVGKTSIARAYANRHLTDYGILWWVRAEDPSAVDAEFRALLEVVLPLGQADQVGDARTAALNLLAGQQDPWLLVLDNVRDAAAAQGLLPPAGDGHVLITSRDPRWPDATTVEPFDPDTAILLLGHSDEDAARALAAELGGLPLALTQAAGFMRANAISVAAYLRLYLDRGAELHAEGKPADYPHTVATTWQLAMDRLTDTARELLNLIAFYAPDAIPVHLLLGSWDELTRHRAIGELVSYGLVSSAGEDKIMVHPLVQAVTRARLRADQLLDEWADRAHELIMAVRPRRPATANGLATWVALHPHMLALVEHLPPEHPATLMTRLALAEGIGDAGNATRARELCAELLPIRERVSGPEHPETLATTYALAHWTARAGLDAQARDLFAELLPTLERVRGVEHPDTLLTRHHLAHEVGVAGDPLRARDLHAELLPVMERVMGVEHRDTLFARQTLAHWTGRSGDWSGAWDLLTELLAVQVRVLGAEDPVTLGTRSAMAHWAPDVASARDLYVELLPLQARVLGAEHPDTLGTRRRMADLAGWEEGDAVSARDLYAELLALHERAFGAEHPNTLNIRSSLAWWTKQAGDSARARTLLAELLPIQERVLGVEHPDTVRTRENLDFDGRWGSGTDHEIRHHRDIPQPPKLPGAAWYTRSSWQDELRRLDEDLAAGVISAGDYRARRDQILSTPTGNKGMPPGHSPN